MFIKLQPDQVSIHWDLVRDSIIKANNIPKEFQQDYAIYALTKIHSGMFQVWVQYTYIDDVNKDINAIVVTSILDEKFHGVRLLNAETLYKVKEITDEILEEIIKGVEEFAKANNCNVLSADYSFGRVKEILTYMGFEEHRTICRKFI